MCLSWGRVGIRSSAPGGALDLGGEVGEGAVPQAGQPLLGDGEPIRSQRVQVARADAVVIDETGAAEDPQMLAHPGAAHRQSVGELPDRQRPGAQHLDDPASYRIAQRVEDALGVGRHDGYRRATVARRQPFLRGTGAE